MKLYLKGHNERYPVEQLQMQLFGDRPTQFVETPSSPENGVSTNCVGRSPKSCIWSCSTG